MKILSIVYPNGNIRINVGTFFSTAPQKNIKKILLLASQHCSTDDRYELIKTLTSERSHRKDVLNTVEELRKQIGYALTPYFDYQICPSETGWEKNLKKQRAKIAKSLEILEEVWPV